MPCGVEGVFTQIAAASISQRRVALLKGRRSSLLSNPGRSLLRRNVRHQTKRAVLQWTQGSKSIESAIGM